MICFLILGGLLPLNTPKSKNDLFWLFQQERNFPKFISKDMEMMYVEELRSSVNLLMANLESQPVAKDFKPKIKPKLTPMNSFLDIGDENDLPLCKSDVVLSFNLEVQAYLFI